ncbi:MAG TPA: shikimate kinase [Gemmatimonadaceae bacterium]|nr:shikimate kinase [Gemmatimonadaceae bacterium]
MTATFRTSNPVSAADPRRPHLILVGLPGAGKSTVGKGVAARLARTFLDFDQEIERREGKTIAEIFGEKGEGHFRELERVLTEELSQMGNMILAPGGGWVSNPQVVGLLRPPARLIYLRVRPETALERLGSERSTRPLLMRPDPLGEIRRLLDTRKAAYESADHVIEAELLSTEEVIKRVSSLALGTR